MQVKKGRLIPTVLVAAVLVLPACGDNARRLAEKASRGYLEEWGAPGTRRVRIEIDRRGSVRVLFSPRSSESPHDVARQVVDGQVAEAILRGLAEFRFRSTGRTPLADARRLRVGVETPTRDFELVIRGELTSEEREVVSKVNALLPKEYRLEEYSGRR